MNKLWIVAKETYRKHVKSMSFLGMVFGPILMLCVFAGIGYFAGSASQEGANGQVAIVAEDQASDVTDYFKQVEDGNEYTIYDSQDQAQAAVKEGQADAYLLVESDQASYYQGADGKELNKDIIQTTLDGLVKMEIAKANNIDSQQIAAINQAHMPLKSLEVSEDGTSAESDDSQKGVRTGLAYVVSFAVFLFIMFYVSIISQEIAAEKGSRIMEIVLSSITATNHFLGKILGVMLVLLTQILIYLVLGTIFFFVARSQGWLDFLNDLPFDVLGILGQAPGLIAISILFGILGIIIYTFLAGFLGSLVSKTEDVNKLIQPIVLLAVAGFYIGMFGLAAIDNPVVRFGSFFPFFTPFVMPFRMAEGSVSTMEISLSILIVLVTVILVAWISIALYKNNVLIYTDQGLLATLKRSLQLSKNEKQEA